MVPHSTHVKSLMILYLNTKSAATGSVTLCLFISAASNVSINIHPCFKRESYMTFLNRNGQILPPPFWMGAQDRGAERNWSRALSL